MKRNGFTLVELLVVIGILGILVGLSLPEFGRFVRKGRIENQTRRLYADIMNTRVMAMNRNMSHFIVFGYSGDLYLEDARRYSIIADTNSNNTADVPPAGGSAGDTQVLMRGGADTVPFTFTGAVPQNQAMSAAGLGNQVIINARGVARGNGSPAGTICIANQVNIAAQPSCNCIVVNTTKVSMGKILLGATCNAANCN